MARSLLVSPHLSWKELACHEGTPYPREWEDRSDLLGRMFEWIRGHYGFPVKLNSAYRTEAYNRQIGGARLSQHVQGRALDLTPVAGGSLRRLVESVRAARDAGLVQGLGLYDNFVHADCGGRTRNATWYGSRKAETQFSL